MAKRNICVILMLSSLFIALQIGGNYATKESGVDAEEELWFQSLCLGNEKVAKIQLYVQDQLTGPNRTIHKVAEASITANHPTSFGMVQVFDDPLTAVPERNSKVVARAQGFLISSDFSERAFTQNTNIVFTAGEYSGSTISLLGRNQIRLDRRELSVVGGTGVFRFARGYAVETTYSSDAAAGYDVLKFNIYATYVSKPSKHL